MVQLIVIACQICLSSWATADDAQLSRDKVVEVASREAAKMGYDLNTLAVDVSEYSTPWNRCLDREATSAYARERLEKLTGRDYYAVVFWPKEFKGVGGGLCVYVDKHSGEIITSIRNR